MTKRRVCIVSHSHPDFSKGGGEVAAFRQYKTQLQEGWDVLFAAASEVNTKYAESRRIDQIVAHSDREFLYEFSGMDEDRLSWRDPYKRRSLARFFADLNADIYHFHHYWRVGFDLIADLMEMRPHSRFVLTAHEMLAICLHHGQMIKTRGNELCNLSSAMRCLSCFPDKDVNDIIMRKAYILSVMRRFHHISYPSVFIQKRYEEWGLKTVPSIVLENYLGDDLFSRLRGVTSDSALNRRFGFFGQPTAFKGLNILLAGFSIALQTERNLSLTVYGATRDDVISLFPDLKRVVDGMGRNVSFAGRYDPADALDLMQSVGWIVVPSIWWENSPVVIQEARRIGTPLIVSDIGGMAEKVEPGIDGMHFKRASPVDLARVLLVAAKKDVHEAYRTSVRDSIGKAEFLDGLDVIFGEPR